LDGNIPADRHKAAFCIAVELGRMRVPMLRAQEIVRRWARDIGYSQRAAERGVKSAYERTPSGDFRYLPPGFNKAGPVYAETLGPLCQIIGCPDKCTPFAGV